MTTNRIEENISYQNLKKQINALNLIAKVVKFFAFFGIMNTKVNDAISKLKGMNSQFNFLSKGPDKFNDYFAKLG